MSVMHDIEVSEALNAPTLTGRSNVIPSTRIESYS